MERREWTGQLRGAVYRGDGAAVVGLLRADTEPLALWQLIGDGAAVALAQQIDGAPQLVADCVAALRERDRVGDAELEEDTPDLDDVERFRWADGDSRDGYRDMVEFIDTVPDERPAERLGDAIHGRGAFRRFADTLRRANEDELSRWFEFTGERKRGRARAWLADAGYRVTVR